MKKNRKVFLGQLGMTALLCLGTGCGASNVSDNTTTVEKAESSEITNTEEKTEISIALNYTLGAEHGGLIAAQELGYFDEAGLDVKIVPWSSQTSSL